MKIFKILFISFVLFSGLGAQAGKVSSLNYRPLIAKLQQKIQARKKMFTESNLLKFTISPAAPKATEDVTLFIQPVTGFTDSEILLQTTFDGTDNTANLEHPATELWVVDLGSFTELRPYTLDAKIFIRDKNSAQLIIDAMAALDASIADLNNQIAAATDPAVIADLTAQRDDKIAQKNQLATTLAGLQSQVGEETFTFNVNEDTTLSDYPKIQSVTPNVVKTNTALAFTIAGSNLANTTQVKVDGTAVTTSLITSTSISAIATPTTDGPHSLEVRTVSGTQIKNVILQNAIFSTSKDLYVPNTPPTAVAAAVSSPINLGSSAQVTAAGSFDANNFSLGYAWRFKTVPSGATEVAGSTILGTSSTYSFNPSVPGLYVLQLIVTETQGSLLPSSAAYAIVEVTAPANRAALIGSKPINTLINQSASVTIYGLDLDLWQAHSYFITKQGTLGTATISNNVVTYTAGSTSGSDTITVAVVDNGTPPMANSINIPVTVYALNTAPSFSSVSAQAVTEGLPVTVRFTVNGLADSNGLGTISEIKIQPGDGTTEYAPTNGGNLGILGHNYVAYGTYTATVTVTDNLGASYSQNLTVTVQANDLPTAKFSMNKYSCTAPCTLTVDASASTDSNGISEYRWLWGDGSAEQSTTSTTVTHTFNSNGNYRFRLRTIDSLGAVGESMANIYVGVTAPSSGSPSYPDFINTTIREVTAGTPVSFNAARSFDPNPSGNITNYSWNASGCSGSCTATGSTSSFAYSTIGSFFPTLTTTNALGGTATASRAEIINVVAGHAPRSFFYVNNGIQVGAVTGVAPLLVYLDSSPSFDYDGTITSRLWTFGDGSTATDPIVSKIYTSPGVYFLTLKVTDNDGNSNIRTQMISVTASRAQKLMSVQSDDPDEKQMLTESCGQGNAEACYALAQIYKDEGDSYVSNSLMQRACLLGYQPACAQESYKGRK